MTENIRRHFDMHIETYNGKYDDEIISLILDTPSVARVSHKFYEKARFRKTDKTQLPIEYVYPNRDSLLYMLDL